MKSWNTIQNELKELNTSLPLDKLPEAYKVPEGYFENLADLVLQRIKNQPLSVQEELESLSPVLAGLSKKMPFSVPQGYFDEASEAVPAIIASEQLPEIILQAGKSIPYEIPTGYFDKLPGEVLKKLNLSKPTAKVISINTRKWMGYAAAAVIAGIIAVSGIIYFNGNSGGSSVQSDNWVATQLKNVSDQELDAFITDTDVNAPTLAQNAPAGKTEIRSLLKDVPDSELEKFLDEVPFYSEDAQNIN